MRVRAVTFFLMAVMSQQIGWAQGAQPRFSLSISAANTSAKAGSEIKIRIIQKNVTNQEQPFWVWKNYESNGEYLFRIHVSGTDGSKPPRSKYFGELVDDAGNFTGGGPMSGGVITRKPGESITSSIDLNELYELKPGKYTVQVYQKDSIGKVTVKSNAITLTVTP